MKPVFVNGPRCGEAHPRAKLKEADVIAIRKRYVRRSHKNGAGGIAKDYGIDQRHILRIVDGHSWKKVKAPDHEQV